ncbi:hypothetical protein P343_13710 [Sporolactobacillus laevolacticus DSM 442]|uniref:Uncharacterized protein n=1 Tax=Sporolactobacillus laevolacticus DSM 442 TaxID=1395513 RepID=V6IV59_9BACL|nr:hypothetical protein P343_13710 [Sporolactobacillus laevolacticus DSM 442]
MIHLKLIKVINTNKVAFSRQHKAYFSVRLITLFGIYYKEINVLRILRKIVSHF